MAANHAGQGRSRVLEGQTTGLSGTAVPVVGDAPVAGRGALQAELAFERAVFAHPQLSAFRRNATSWEVLLLLAADPGDPGPGLYEVIDAVETRALGASALLSFLRARRDEGTLIFTRNPRKRSKWSLSLRPDLRDDLRELMERRATGSSMVSPLTVGR